NRRQRGSSWKEGKLVPRGLQALHRPPPSVQGSPSNAETAPAAPGRPQGPWRVLAAREPALPGALLPLPAPRAAAVAAPGAPMGASAAAERLWAAKADCAPGLALGAAARREKSHRIDCI
uniref:Uncharacterized protein n=1 Tax=Nothoprocta perdicaria TaxID=30464 RepID=A0A8C6Z3V8_NOTPE